MAQKKKSVKKALKKTPSKKTAKKKVQKKTTSKKKPQKKKPKKKPKILNAREKKFVSEVVKDDNAYQAGIRAGYTERTAHGRCSNWVAKDRKSCPKNKLHVWDAVQKKREKLLEKTDMDSVEVLKLIATVARFDIRKLFNEDDTMKKITELDDETAFALSSVEIVQNVLAGNKKKMNISEFVKKVKTNCKMKALELMGKHHKLFVDVQEIVPAKGGKMLQVTYVDAENGKPKKDA